MGLSRTRRILSDEFVITFSVGDGVTAIVAGAGVPSLWLPIPACTILAVEAIGDVASGSIVLDLWVDTYANAPATDADSITASAPITISAAQKVSDATLTGWTKTFAGYRWMYVHVDSASTFKRVQVMVKARR